MQHQHTLKLCSHWLTWTVPKKESNEMTVCCCHSQTFFLSLFSSSFYFSLILEREPSLSVHKIRIPQKWIQWASDVWKLKLPKEKKYSQNAFNKRNSLKTKRIVHRQRYAMTSAPKRLRTVEKTRKTMQHWRMFVLLTNTNKSLSLFRCVFLWGFFSPIPRNASMWDCLLAVCYKRSVITIR